jgi:intraflagellar transport protein 46
MKAVRDEKESSSEEEDDEDHAQSTSSAGNESSNRVGPAGYNPADYAHLNVSAEIKELFQYIGRYKPHQIELETRVKCFIPDYIPAVGEIDAFIKVPKPDGKPDDLGLVVVDEPAAEQSDPTVLELQMRAITKKHNLEPMVVRSIENAAHNTKDIQRWIDSIEELHKSKPPPQVHYSKNMPDIEGLMQIWPEDVEQVLGEVELPPSDIDASVAEYARVICAIMDIPVYEGSSPNAIVQSLHVLFTLYSEFNQNQHFTGGAVAGVVGKGAGIELGESKEIEDSFSKDISANNRFDMEESKLMHK